MVIIVVAMALLAIYANVQKVAAWRDRKSDDYSHRDPAAGLTHAPPISLPLDGRIRSARGFRSNNQEPPLSNHTMKKFTVLPLIAALAFFVSCQKQQTEEERKAEVERQVQERVAAERLRG